MGLFSLSKSKFRLSRPANDLNKPEYKSHSRNTSSSSSSSDAFTTTSQLQVHAIGYDMNQALSGRTHENISVHRVASNEAEAEAEHKYISIRPTKNSNSCALVRASDPDPDPNQNPLISTIYRVGPGRRPRMRILPSNTNNNDTILSVEEAIDMDNASLNMRSELIDVKSRSMVSRAQVLDTSFGKFEWRYGTAEEHEDCNADSLLVMERIDRVLMSDGKKCKGGTRVAQLVRNDRLRTPGTKKYSGGNGGRLMMDLRLWDDEKGASADCVEAFVVASCILMLKREADRFIDNHLAMVV